MARIKKQTPHVRSLRPDLANSEQANTLFVNSLEKGLRVLQAFGEEHAELGVTEIANVTNMDKSAAQRFSNTLHVLGFLDKDPITRRYRPALRLLDFFYAYMCNDHLAEIAMVRLVEAGQVFQTSINLCQLDGNEIVYTVRIPHQKAPYLTMIPGRRVPAFCSSGGIAILSRLPEREAKEIIDASDLKQRTPKTMVDREKIFEAIAETRELGYRISVEQTFKNEITISAPVIGADGGAVAAVQIPSYMPNWTVSSVREKLAPLVVETAVAISKPLRNSV